MTKTNTSDESNTTDDDVKRSRMTLERGGLLDEHNLLSVPEAAKLLGVSEHTMRRLIASKSMPSVRVGFFVRVRESDVRAFVDRQLDT